MRRALLTLFLTSALAPSALLAGGMGMPGSGTLENAADREITRRQGNLAVAEDAIRRGDAALAAKDVEAAYNAYKEAVDMIPAGSESSGLHARALSRFSSTAVRYAEYLVSQGEYARAEAVAREVLEPRYNPNYRPAAVFLSRLERPDYFNKTITPEFAADRSKVEQLLLEAQGFTDSGRYDMAQKRYTQVLEIDKYNTAAFRGMEEVELGKQRYYDSAYNETRSRMLWQVDKAWERPRRNYSDIRTSDASQGQEQRRGTELMIARLNRIIVPKISFRDAPVRQAVDFLRQESRRLDASDVDGKGINIILKQPSAAALAATASVAGEDGEAAPIFNDRISLNLSNVPLYEALRYVATLSGLKVKVEPYAVSLVPLSEPTDTIEQREFKVPPGFITAATSDSADNVPQAGRGGADDGKSIKLASRLNAKDFLQSQGVDFPPGSSANFIPGRSRLIVRNTAANLDFIESLVDAAMGEQPTQVEIQSKFVEISQNNMKELGFSWALGPFSIGGDSGTFGSGGSIADNPQAWPFVGPGGSAIGTDAVTSGLRSGTGNLPGDAISVSGIDSLIAQNNGIALGTGPSPGIFSIAGVFTNPQFQAVIRALNQKKGVDLMAAPKVTTKSGQEATITISREFPYPEQFDPPQIPQRTDSDTVTQVWNPILQIFENRGSDPIVTPAFPTSFTTRNLGVTLKVTPQIGPDGYTIDLKLDPEVVEFDGFINYGSPIAVPVTRTVLDPNTLLALGQTTTPRIMTDNVINQPIFSKRKVETNVSIWDGQTVALGGLIREDVQTVKDKVPVLGDIPLAGALFRSNVDQKIKKNLIIFVTARLMDPAGQLLRPEDDMDQEEIVEPVGLPKELQQPRMSSKGFTQK